MKVAVIGCGVMGGALATHFAKQGNGVILCSKNQEKCHELAKKIGAKVEENPTKAAEEAEVILIGIKPKDLPAIKAPLSAVSKGKVVISVLAGVSVATLKEYFPHASVLRTMPNLPLTVGQGVIGVVDDGHISPQTRKVAETLFHGIGLLAWLPENKMESLTALTGSGPALILVLIEALIEGGVSLGFSLQESREFVLKTIEGTVALLHESKKHPAEIKMQIASPGGTTIAGLKEMEVMNVRAGILNSLHASYQRAKQMLEEKK